jgi:hypothetical protein
VLPIFRNTSPYTVIILLIITVFLKLHVLLHPVAATPVEGYYIYNHLLHWLDFVFNGNAFIYTLFAVLNIFSQAIYLNNICNKYKLFTRHGYLPALSYLLFSSIYPAFSYFSLPLLVNWFLIWAIGVILGFGQTLQPRKHIFNAGFILCSVALLQFSALSYILFLLLCLVVLRPFNISEWVVAMMGYFTPIYFLACLLYLIDRMDIIYGLPRLGISLPAKAEWKGMVVISGLIILLFSGVYAMQLQTAKANVYVRRNWIAIIICLIVSLPVAIFADNVVKSAWLVLVPALSLLISNAFSLEKSKWFSNFAFYFSLAFIVYCQWALK